MPASFCEVCSAVNAGASPIGDPPALTAEQESQNQANTNNWTYIWNESGQSWDLTDSMA